MKGQLGPADSPYVFEAGMSLCAATLARAHARSVDPALLSGYLGDSGEHFIEPITSFARAYADQAERDYARLLEAIRKGELPAEKL
jgi:RecB family exonuclease